MKTTFLAEELLAKGFKPVVEEEVTYLEYIFNEEDYFNSPFLATTDVKKVDVNANGLNETLDIYRVINNVNPDNGEAFLTEDEIDFYIANGI
jgi:hypothetical protein